MPVFSFANTILEGKLARCYSEWLNNGVPGTYEIIGQRTFAGDTILMDKNIKMMREIFSGNVELMGKTNQDLPILQSGNAIYCKSDDYAIGSRKVECLEVIINNLTIPIRPLNAYLETGIGNMNVLKREIPVVIYTLQFQKDTDSSFKWQISKVTDAMEPGFSQLLFDFYRGYDDGRKLVAGFFENFKKRR